MSRYHKHQKIQYFELTFANRVGNWNIFWWIMLTWSEQNKILLKASTRGPTFPSGLKDLSQVKSKQVLSETISFNFSSIFLRDGDRAVVLAHVKEHYRLPALSRLTESEDMAEVSEVNIDNILKTKIWRIHSCLSRYFVCLKLDALWSFFNF